MRKALLALGQQSRRVHAIHSLLTVCIYLVLLKYLPGRGFLAHLDILGREEQKKKSEKTYRYDSSWPGEQE